MNCYAHPDKPALAWCRACAKGACVHCGVDIGRGLACMGACEREARAALALQQPLLRPSTLVAGYGLLAAVLLAAGFSRWDSSGSWLVLPGMFFAILMGSSLARALQYRWFSRRRGWGSADPQGSGPTPPDR